MRKIIIRAAMTVTHDQYADAAFSACNNEMMRLTYQRHAAYARAHNFDYWHITGSVVPERPQGGWDKIYLIRLAMMLNYDFIAWIDADAGIMDFDVDLVDALPEDKLIGACWHDADWFKDPKNPIDPHYNIGVTYWRNQGRAWKFVQEWYDSYPGVPRWAEQGQFNLMVAKDEYKDIFHRVDDSFNATVNVNEVEKPVVKGWHGVVPIAKRLAMMRVECANDFLKFKV